MIRMLKLALLFVILMPALLCAEQARGATQKKILTVAAAADMTYALKEIAAGFEQDTGVGVVVSYGSTGILTNQIRNGAPFDVFLAADASVVRTLAADGFIVTDSVMPYATGVIVLAVRSESGMRLDGIKDLLRPDIRWIAIANPDHAPYGRAAKEALISAGIWEAIKQKVVFGENVSQTVKFIQTGDADAGIVALSVAHLPGIRFARIDGSAHNPIEQAAGILMASKEQGAAREFLKYLSGTRSAAILKRYGFGEPVGVKGQAR